MQICAIVGASASGKSALGLQIAQHLQSCGQKIALFSLDSLAVYREINIASAKPSAQNLAQFRHFAIDLLAPNEPCSFGVFANALQCALEYCAQTDSKLLIVGGSGFYLKAMRDGISESPKALNAPQKQQLEMLLANPANAHALLAQIDPQTAQKTHDSYRLRKAFEIYLATSMPPSQYFATHPKKTFLPANLPVFELHIEREQLWQNITKRTETMLQDGLLDEVSMVVSKYGRDIQPAKSIGFRECLAYFDKALALEQLANQIAIHTRQFAKRQRTFNRTQLGAIPLCKESLFERIMQLWQRE